MRLESLNKGFRGWGVGGKGELEKMREGEERRGEEKRRREEKRGKSIEGVGE